jgi:hypothetical protein
MLAVRFLTSPIKFVDKIILEYLIKSGRVDAYYTSVHFRASVGADIDFNGLKDVMLKDVGATDAKSAPLLSHVSLMIAVVAVFLSSTDLGYSKKIFLGFEMMVYILIALCCLRCIHVEEIGVVKETYLPKLHVVPKMEALFAEPVLKIHILRFANGLAMLLTAFLMVTTPLLFLF